MADDGTVDIARAQAVLDFWLGEPGEPHAGEPRKIWSVKDAAFDAEIGARLGSDYRAAAGALAAWRESAEPCLALIVVLD